MYSEIGLDLQSFAKRVYDSILYQSTFYNFLSPNYIGELRQTKEIASRLNPSLVGYNHTMVDLTELNMDYSVRIPLMVAGSDIANAIQDAADLEDSAIAKQIDTYGFGKLADTTMSESAWKPLTKDDYITLLNGLRATLFNKDVIGDYRLGLGAVEYSNLVSALTSVIKFENMEVNEGVTLGEMARVYGISIFEINDNVLDGAIGYFFNPIAVVGDTFFSAFVQHTSPQGFPGYYVLEGTQSFGAAVVRPEAIIRLVEEVSA